jgi:hypothetical protein
MISGPSPLVGRTEGLPTSAPTRTPDRRKPSGYWVQRGLPEQDTSAAIRAAAKQLSSREEPRGGSDRNRRPNRPSSNAPPNLFRNAREGNIRFSGQFGFRAQATVE